MFGSCFLKLLLLFEFSVFSITKNKNKKILCVFLDLILVPKIKLLENLHILKLFNLFIEKFKLIKLILHFVSPHVFSLYFLFLRIY